MGVRNLDKIFKPKRIAVIGANDTPGSVGFSVLRNLIGTGFDGVVYPVNVKRESVQGIHAYSRISALPNVPDLAIVATPAATVPDLIRECGEAGVGGMIILAAGFKEVGAAGRNLEAQLLAASQQFPHLRIIGPNCLGIIAPHRHLNASFAGSMPRAGNVAFLSQSGALCTSALDWAQEEHIGFSHFVSIGNMLDVSIADLIDYFGDDPETHSLILYLESITEAREFMSAARAFTRTKPIVAYKAGRFAESARAAASHTGAMAGEDAVFDAAFERAGIVRAFEIDDIFDCAELLAKQHPPTGPHLAIITNAGGPGVMATDALIARQGKLAQLSETTLAALNEALPDYWSHGNPVDVLGDATPERFVDAFGPVLHDPQVDGILVILTPQAMTDPSGIARAIGRAAQKAHKPVLAAWMGGASVHEGISHLNDVGIPTYTSPEHAIRAFMHLVAYGRNLEVLYETPRDIPINLSSTPLSDKKPQRDVFIDRPLLSEIEAKQRLADYGIPVTMPGSATNAEEAAALADEIGYPVVLKVLSPQITHKTDVGGVVLNLRHRKDVREAFAQIEQSVREHEPEAQFDGVSVQQMVTAEFGIELILGAHIDLTFGAVILVGTGGVAAEILRDRSLGLPPLNERLARRMLESLQSWPLLKGYRGRPGVNIDRLIEILVRFSYLIADSPEILECDINPLLATPTDMLALDARIVIDPQKTGPNVRPYSHLAIRPYPEQFTQQQQTRDGDDILLRAIRPEDEPRWHALLATCTPDSIRSRFRSLFKNTTHAMATRYCFIDYDRELAIVAEIEEDGEKKLIGVGRLVADVNHESAEYAILVADPWQGRGIGSLLTGYCLKIAAIWGIREIVAETDWNNRRMLATFKEYGFEVVDRAEGVVSVRKSLPESAEADLH